MRIAARGQIVMVDALLTLSIAKVAGIGVGVLLLAVSTAKLIRFDAFANVVSDLNVVPPWAARTTALAVACAELALAGALLSRWQVEYAAAGTAALFLGFGALFSVKLIRGDKRGSCGCTGTGGGVFGWPLVVRNSGLALVSVAAAPGVPGGCFVAGLVLTFGSMATARFLRTTHDGTTNPVT
jgi:hypothetical protein